MSRRTGSPGALLLQRERVVQVLLYFGLHLTKETFSFAVDHYKRSFRYYLFFCYQPFLSLLRNTLPRHWAWALAWVPPSRWNRKHLREWDRTAGDRWWWWWWWFAMTKIMIMMIVMWLFHFPQTTNNKQQATSNKQQTTNNNYSPKDSFSTKMLPAPRLFRLLPRPRPDRTSDRVCLKVTQKKGSKPN